MINKFYFLLAGLLVLLFVFFIGRYTGVQQCLLKNQQNITQQQIDIIKIQRDVNAEAFNRGVGDIRDVLRQKYTIAD